MAAACCACSDPYDAQRDVHCGPLARRLMEDACQGSDAALPVALPHEGECPLPASPSALTKPCTILSVAPILSVVPARADGVQHGVRNDIQFFVRSVPSFRRSENCLCPVASVWQHACLSCQYCT